MFVPDAEQQSLLEKEAHRLYGLLSSVSHNNGEKWSLPDCYKAAFYTLRINRLKKEKNAIILAHSYTVPELVYGVADFSGDSYALSRKAVDTQADIILFAGVWFMAETAKILNPSKRVIIPAGHAGCTLADAITEEEVRSLRAAHPGVPVLCYVNSTAGVKAQSDVCVTSGNVFDIAAKMPQKELIFVPDLLMARNLEIELAKRGVQKKIIAAGGSCCVHNKYKVEHVSVLRRKYPGIKVLAHPECHPEVCAAADYVGSTQAMTDYVAQSADKIFGVLTEQGLVNRLEAEYKDKTFIGAFGICSYMKQNTLDNTMRALLNPSPDQEVQLPAEVITQARKSLQNMFEMSR